jgi:hypothetical protein
LLRHPFERLSPRKLGAAAGLAAALSILVAALLFKVAEAGPGFDSLADLVWARTSARAGAVFSSWSDAQAEYARLFAGLHGLFVAFLFNALALAACWAGRALGSALAQAVGAFLAWLAWLCVAAEIPEALALHRLVRGSVEAPWPQIAATSTWFHHLVLYVGLLFVTLVLVGRLSVALGRRRHGSRPAA